MKPVKFLIIIFVVASNLHCSITDPNKPGEVIKLRYGWYPGILASVQYHHVKTRKMPGQQSGTVQFQGNFQIRTKEHPNGLQIDGEGGVLEMDDENNAIAQHKFEGFIQRLAEVNPSFIIDKKGTLQEIVRFDEFRQTVEQETSKLLPKKAGQPFLNTQLFLDRFASREQVLSMLLENWNRDVGQWVDSELEQGQTYRVETKRPMYLLGDVEVLNVGHYEYMGRVPCDQADQKSSCVKLYFHCKVDEDSAKSAFRSIFNDIGIDKFGEMGVNIIGGLGVNILYDLELITEERTLLPHYIKETKLVDLEGMQHGFKFEKQDLKEIQYTYLER